MNQDEIQFTEPLKMESPQTIEQHNNTINPFNFWNIKSQDSAYAMQYQLSEKKPITHWKPYINEPGVTTFRKQVHQMPYYILQNSTHKQSTLSHTLSKETINSIKKDVSKDQHLSEPNTSKILAHYRVNNGFIVSQETIVHKRYEAVCCTLF